MSKLTVGGLLSGVGGIELAFRQAGFDIKWAEKVINNCPKVNEKLENYFKDIIQKGREKLQ